MGNGQLTRITIRVSSAVFESLKRLSLKIWSTVLNPLFPVDDDKNKVSLIVMTRRKFRHFAKSCWKIVSQNFIEFQRS